MWLYDYFLLTIIGGLTGLLAGVVGSGADVLIVPFLLFFHVFRDIKFAIGTSLAMLLPPVGIWAVYKYYKKGYVNIPYALYLAVVFTGFSVLSAQKGMLMDKNLLRKGYSIFLGIVGIITWFSKE